MKKYAVKLRVLANPVLRVDADSEEEALQKACDAYSNLPRTSLELTVTKDCIEQVSWDREFVKQTALEMWYAFRTGVSLLGIQGFREQTGNPKADRAEICEFILTRLLHQEEYAEFLRKTDPEKKMDPVHSFCSEADVSCMSCPMTSGFAVCGLWAKVSAALDTENLADLLSAISRIIDSIHNW